ncbi:MAG: in-like protease [Frankiales bacterium]|nr:in-like protease [Frankiales bacterium]
MSAIRPTRTLGVLALALAGSVSVSPAHAAQGARTVVVTGRGDAAAAVQQAGGTVLRRLPLVHGVIARVSRPIPGFTVTADGPMTLTGREKGYTRGTTEVMAREVVDAPDGGGAGVTVAVVDTGVADVAELAGRVTHIDVTGTGTGDGYGHGTFVASLVAGSVHGVAPAARVLDVRVGHPDGSTSLVDVLSGLQAVADNRDVSVVNLSLSTDEEVPPLTDALEALWAQGDLVVVPAGNGGPGRGTVASPGTDPLLLTVGALDGDSVADWSARGGAGVKGPDLVAPGAHLLSAGLPGSVLWAEHPDARRGDAGFVGSGTSFSTALVSGASAVLLAGRPQLSPYQLKALLQRSARDVRGPRAATGAGALDLGEAQVRRVPRDDDPAGGTNGTSGADSSGDASSGSASSWSARQWAASSWSARQWSARQWSARQWSASSWG